jgi:hypothetical protein
MTIQVYGAPLTGNTLYYAAATDSTKAITNEVSFLTLPITPIPTMNFGAGFTNITKSHFDPMVIGASLVQAYTFVIPQTVFFGVMLGMIVVGLWRRNRAIRLVSIVFIILSPFVMTASIGLEFGVPLAEQALGQALLAVGIAGIFISWLKR